MDGTSLLILAVVAAIVLGALWAARGWSGLDRKTVVISDDPYVRRGEPGGPRGTDTGRGGS